MRLLAFAFTIVFVRTGPKFQQSVYWVSMFFIPNLIVKRKTNEEDE